MADQICDVRDCLAQAAWFAEREGDEAVALCRSHFDVLDSHEGRYVGLQRAGRAVLLALAAVPSGDLGVTWDWTGDSTALATEERPVICECSEEDNPGCPVGPHLEPHLEEAHWRVSPADDRDDFVYLCSACTAPQTERSSFAGYVFELLEQAGGQA